MKLRPLRGSSCVAFSVTVVIRAEVSVCNAGGAASTVMTSPVAPISMWASSRARSPAAIANELIWKPFKTSRRYGQRVAARFQKRKGVFTGSSGGSDSSFVGIYVGQLYLCSGNDSAAAIRDGSYHIRCCALGKERGVDVRNCQRQGTDCKTEEAFRKGDVLELLFCLLSI